tara:strand:- start:179 stop:430 length:252 start_codon:yes stop_codon:yes gene_type:complete
MKRLPRPRNKFALIAINVAFIAIWEEFTGLIIEIIWETIDELGFFNQNSYPILVIEILFLIVPILSFTYWIWWGKKIYDKKIK